jgi:hypothetical protein
MKDNANDKRPSSLAKVASAMLLSVMFAPMLDLHKAPALERAPEVYLNTGG